MPVDVEPREYLDRVRAEMNHEDELINARLVWLLASQAFLFGAYTNALQKDNYFLALHGEFLIPIVGLVTCGFIFMGVLTAINSFNHWKLRLKAFQQDPTNRHFPNIKKPVYLVGLGFLAPVVLPVFLACIWIWIGWHNCVALSVTAGAGLVLALIFVFEPGLGKDNRT